MKPTNSCLFHLFRSFKSSGKNKKKKKTEPAKKTWVLESRRLLNLWKRARINKSLYMEPFMVRSPRKALASILTDTREDERRGQIEERLVGAFFHKWKASENKFLEKLQTRSRGTWTNVSRQVIPESLGTNWKGSIAHGQRIRAKGKKKWREC